MDEFKMNLRLNLLTPILWLFKKLFLQRFYDRFLKSLENPAQSQRNLLKVLIKDLSKTEYGQEHKVLENDSYQEFQSKLPVVSYGELEKYIHKMRAQNVSGILTSKKTLCWETTSGSSGPKKLIPYNRDLLNSFENTFKIWACDLLINGLKLNKAKIFFSISPFGGGDKQIGFKSDFEYLGKLLSFILKFFVLDSTKAKAQTTLESFQKELSLSLLKETDLEVISIWSPTYFLSFLNYIEKNSDWFIHKLETNMMVPFLAEKPIPWQKIWPNLKLISCWSSAGAAQPAKHLATIFTNVKLQGKGLLCTQAPLTIPFGTNGLCLPLLEEVFFEFLGDDGKIKLIYEVEVDAIYELIISQKGGFMRYKNGDKVKVLTMFQNSQVPHLEFVGRGGQTSDLAGEKLSEGYINSVFKNLSKDLRWRKVFSSCCFLLPYTDETFQSQYLLVSEYADNAFCKELETELLKSHHYKIARTLGQLAELKLQTENQLITKIQSFFCQQKGIKLGDLKDFHLLADQNLANELLSSLTSQSSN